MNAPSTHAITAPVTGVSPTLGPALTFLRYELRRHLPAVLGAWALLLLAPLIQWVVEGRWRYFEHDWNVAVALFAILVMAPVLVFALALSGWSSERQTRTLEWLYARPLSTTRIFVLRLLAILISVTAFSAVALVANRAIPGQTDAGLRMGIETSLGGAVLLASIYTLFAFGLGLLASALSTGVGEALARALVAVAALALFALVLWWLAPTRGVLSQAPFRILPLAALHVGLLALAPVFAFGAAWSLRHSPSDDRRLGRAARVVGPLVLLSGVLGLVFLLQPLRADRSNVQRVVALDGGGELRLASSGLGAETRTQVETDIQRLKPIVLTHPILAGADGGELVLRRVFVEPEDVWPSPVRDRVLADGFDGAREGWLLLGLDGERERIDPGASYRDHPIGWSTGGSYFAWRSGPETEQMTIVVLGNDGQTRTVATPLPPSPAPWSAGWIDDQRLLVTPRPPSSWVLHLEGQPSQAPDSIGPGWWLLIGVDGAAGETRMLAPGEFLVSSALSISRGSACGKPTAVARHGRRIYLWSIDLRRVRLVALDLESGALEPMTGRDWSLALDGGSRPDLSSLGVTAGGTVTWAMLTPGEPTRIMTLEPGAEEPRSSCEFTGWWPGPTLDDGYHGESGGWALWADVSEKLSACHLASGLSRVLQTAELGPRGPCSVDVLEGGVLLTPAGVLRLDG